MVFQMCLIDNTVVSEDSSEAPAMSAIPGLDFDTKISGTMVDISQSLPDTQTAAIMRRKPIYTKPVPRAFERAWAEGREMAPVTTRPYENSVGLLGESPG